MKKRKGQKRHGEERKEQSEKDVPSEAETTLEKELADREVLKRRLAHVPPPDSDIWPPEYRGEHWKRAFRILFAGKCLLCQYSFPQPESRRMRDRWQRQRTPLFCTNHPSCPGELIEVLQSDTCRNFRAKCWRSSRGRQSPAAQDQSGPPPIPKRKRGVRRVPLPQGLFATVDAADFKEIRKHKWSVSRIGSKCYASASINGKTVLMHRFLLRPRKGYQVDHIDGNGLNNCRCNLRVCTQAQNQANRRPKGGSSQYVGVCRRGDRWEAWIKHRGQWITLGRYATEVEAARARDRKAVEIHDRHAYLNFPEDWTFDKHGVGHPVRLTPAAKKPARSR